MGEGPLGAGLRLVAGPGGRIDTGPICARSGISSGLKIGGGPSIYADSRAGGRSGRDIGSGAGTRLVVGASSGVSREPTIDTGPRPGLTGLLGAAELWGG